MSDAERYNVSEIVESRVAAGHGAKLAVIGDDARLTYEELRRQINRAGHMLRELGVRREQRVLLVLDDTTAFPTVFLGAIRIGAVPVPVSPLDKDDNFRHFVDDSYASLVVTDDALLDRVTAALAGRRLRFLVRGRSEPDVIDLDEGLAGQPDELEPAATHRDCW